MAVANSKSQLITDLDANPPVRRFAHLHGLPVYRSFSDVEVAAADDNGSVYRVLRLPSNARIVKLAILNDAITGGTNYGLGVYETAKNLGGVVDADVFASVISMEVARTLGFDATFEAGLDIANGDRPLWQLLGLSSDPQKQYDIAYTGTVVGTSAGTLGLDALWTQ